jgi:hypothetical protein
MVAPEIQNLRQVYGEDKVWKQMNREGILASRWLSSVSSGRSHRVTA